MRHDVAVIGGSFAGLSAAIYLARARRMVAVVDTGKPRNRFASRSHGFFAQDGSAPGAMLATARAQVAAYPTVTFVADEALDATKSADGFSVRLASGEALVASRLVLAFGITDVLPAIPGLAERWGQSALHCPYCHGFEFAGRRLGVLGLSPRSSQQALLISDWGPTTFFLNGQEAPDPATLLQLSRRQVALEPVPVKALHGAGVELSALELADGRMIELAALYLGPPTRLSSALAERLGCALDDGAFGRVVRIDGTGQTTVPGVYAAGDITRSVHNVTWASADGVLAAMSAHRSLLLEPVKTPESALNS